MDYEYSVIGSISCSEDALAKEKESSEFTFKSYTFLLRKFNKQISARLCNSTDCQNISEEDVKEVCEQLSIKFVCPVSMRKGYEVYGNANVFNGGSDYEIIEEKWFKVEFDNGIQKLI